MSDAVQWFIDWPYDKDGKPFPVARPSTDERIAKALESIAASLELIAHPAVVVKPEPTLRRACPVETGGFCHNYCQGNEPCKLAHHLKAADLDRNGASG